MVSAREPKGCGRNPPKDLNSNRNEMCSLNPELREPQRPMRLQGAVETGVCLAGKLGQNVTPNCSQGVTLLGSTQPPNMLFPLPGMLFPLLLTWLVPMHPCSSHWFRGLTTRPSISPTWTVPLLPFLANESLGAMGLGASLGSPSHPELPNPVL